MSEPMAGWNRFDIIAAVRKGGSSLAGIGRTVGLSRKSMSWALIRQHTRANRAIAEFLQKTPHELWPHWFDADGRPLASRPGISHTTSVSKSTPAASGASKTAA